MSYELNYVRQACRPEHENVDRIFSAFDLHSPESYARFLRAHARVVPVLEGWLSDYFQDIAWRGAALQSDMHALGYGMPAEVVWEPCACDGYALGALYVLEGSKLGGKVLAGRVPEGLPKAYLSAGHVSGAWPRFLKQLQAALESGDAAYRANILLGAQQGFALFAAAGQLDA